VHQQLLPQQIAIPFLGGLELLERRLDAARDRLLDHLQRFALQLLTTLERERPQRVDHLALLVHDVVILEQSLA
jgi:hypothetical protein